MRVLATYEEIIALDTNGKLSAYDSTAVEAYIEDVSYDICQRVGHDFGDSTCSYDFDCEYAARTIYFQDKADYPMRERTDDDILLIAHDDSTSVVESSYLKFNHLKGMSLYESMSYRPGYGRWPNDCSVRVTASWGWETVPNDVLVAIYRVVVARMTGDSYGGINDADAALGSHGVKRIRKRDGTEIEYFGNGTSSYNEDSLGNSFADEVVKKYQWRRKWRVI